MKLARTNILIQLALLWTLLFISAPVWANVAANTQIVNQATVSYYDGVGTRTVTASVAFTIALVPSAPAVDTVGPNGGNQTTQYTGPDTTLTNTFTITANANGPDTYTLTPAITGTNGNTLSDSGFGTILPSNTITLGASVIVADSTHTNTATTIYVPSDGSPADSVVNEIQADDWVVVGANNAVQVKSVDDPGGSGIATIVLKTALGLGAPNAGTLVREQQTVTVPLKPGTIKTPGASIVVTKTLTAASTSGSKPSKTSDAITDTYTSGLAIFTKYVRNMTNAVVGGGSTASYGGNTYYTTGVTAKPDDILEYILVVQNIGTGDVSAAVVTDVLPTSYVSLKTGVYSGATDITYVDETGAASYLTATAQGSYLASNLTVNVGTGATSSSGGTIASGKSVLVLYRVTVNNAAQADMIVNSARLSLKNLTPATSAVTVTGVIRTKSDIKLLNACGGQQVIGYTSGDTIYIQVTDLDQNLNKNFAETVTVVLNDLATGGDTETITLTETGPSTGIFCGSLPSSLNASAANNGTLTVVANSRIQATYTDPLDQPSPISIATALIDPQGVVFDSSTGNGVQKTVVTLRNWNNVSNTCDLTSWPSLPSGQHNPAAPTGVDGKFAFPLVPPGDYCFDVTPPAGYTYPSAVSAPDLSSRFPSRFTIGDGSYGGKFTLTVNDPTLILDIPIDPASAALWLQKSAGKDSAGQGDFIPYLLTVTNTGKLVAAGGVSVTDIMPIGFRLRKGSVKVNSVPAGDPTISADGRTLTFNIGDLQAGSSATISYVAEVTAGTRLGDAINSAIASAATGGKSNIAHFTVKIKDDFMRTKSTLMGRVTTGACNEKTGEGPDGVEGVRVYLEDGSFVISDKRGLFHFEGVRSGLHVVQMDLDSLPEGYEAFACTQNSRFAGRAFSQFVETQGCTLWRTDFHVRKKPVTEKSVVVNPPAAPGLLKGETVLQLVNTTEGKNIAYRVAMRGSTLPVGAARLNLILPEGVFYESGSSMMDGVSIADPLQIDNTRLAFKLNDLPAGWHHEITFRGTPSGDRKAGTLVTQAYLTSDGDAKAAVLTPPAETIMQLDKNIESFQMPEITLRPHFPVLGAELNAEDRKKLDELASSLSGLNTEEIHVTGHTDNMRIAPQNRIYYIDNYALSLARAKSVGRYLMEKLHIPPEKLFIEGKGSDQPIADNKTEAGKVLNRRVEVRITSSRVVAHSRLSVLKEQSGEKRAETAAPQDAPEGGNNQSSTTHVGSSLFDSTSSKQQSANTVDLPEANKAVQKQNKDPQHSDSAGAAAVTAGVPSGVTAPAASNSALSSVPADSAKEKSEITIKDPHGILSPGDNDILVNNINAIRVCLDSQLTPRLLVDNKDVPAERIGFTMKDEKAGKTIYSYIGVDFGKTGNHDVQFQGVDPFGNARFNQTISIKRSGEIVSIRLTSAEGNFADGKTPVKLRLELYDASGTRIPAGAELEIREGTLSPLKQPDIFAAPPAAGSHPHVQISREGDVLFQPVNVSGPYRVVLGYNNATVEAETYVQPKLRDWILVGLAEGTVGYNTVSGNMENLQNAGMDDKLYKDNRLALFAKGQIKGKWLLTMAYDSAKTKGNDTSGLFQTINPETYYTLYGDTSQQQYDAASAKNLYIKIEKEQFYAMFGDYDTGMTVTELSRYSRRMTGVKTELQNKNFEVNAFASETDQVYKRDEIPGDGTSGIYHLSGKNIVPNSEKITIEVRNRFHSEILISSSVKTRFTDYSIDYDAGTVIFKEPIYSRDENLNPITIVAEYEILPGSGQDYTYGGRAGVKLFDNKLKAGGSYIHEGQGDQSGNLYGVDTSYKLNQNTKLRAEFATSDVDAGVYSHSGNAYLAEVIRTTKIFDVKAYIREQQPGFGLGQQPAGEAGTRKYGVEGAYRFSEMFRANGDIYRQDNLLTEETRDVAEGKMNYTGKGYSAYAGFLYADDHLDDGSSRESNQLTLGGRIPTIYDRLSLTLDYAQSIGNNDNSDFPTRAVLGAEYKATKNMTLLAAQEFTWGTGAVTQDTRLGMRSGLWEGAALTTSVERQFNENDDRVFADVGLKQTWKVNNAWKMDAGLERSQTVAYASNYQINTNVPPASGTHDDFTSVSLGATYQVKQMTWDNRLEFRLADSENKWGLMSGVVKEIDSSWAWSGRAQVYQTSATAGLNTTKVDLRYGLVFRPPQTQWIVLDRLDFIIDDQSGGTSGHLDSWRLVNNFITNYRPRKDMQLSLHYGAKYVQETIEGSDYSGYTDLLGVEARYDITKDWDIGLQSSILHSWSSGQLDYCEGISIGYNVMQNAWISLGYNLTGFEDKDFSQADFTTQGPFVRFRFKFDQDSVHDAAKWLNGN